MAIPEDDKLWLVHDEKCHTLNGGIRVKADSDWQSIPNAHHLAI